VAVADGPSGTRTVSFSGNGTTGQVDLSIIDRDLREVAIATDGTGASVMADVRYAFGGRVRHDRVSP
jgi:hypothetical protein